MWIFGLNRFSCGRRLSKLPSTCPYEHFEKQFSPAKSSSQSFSELSVIFSESNEISPVGLSKLHYTCPGEQFKEKILLLEKDAFFVNFGHWKKNSGLFFEFSSTQLSKLHSMCPKDHLGGKYSFWETTFLSSVSEIRTNFSANLLKFSGRVITSAPFVSKQTVWGNKFSEKIRVFSICRLEGEMFDLL